MSVIQLLALLLVLIFIERMMELKSKKKDNVDTKIVNLYKVLDKSGRCLVEYKDTLKLKFICDNYIVEDWSITEIFTLEIKYWNFLESDDLITKQFKLRYK